MLLTRLHVIAAVPATQVLWSGISQWTRVGEQAAWRWVVNIYVELCVDRHKVSQTNDFRTCKHSMLGRQPQLAVSGSQAGMPR